jgi:hypothetical protein
LQSADTIGVEPGAGSRAPLLEVFFISALGKVEASVTQGFFGGGGHALHGGQCSNEHGSGAGSARRPCRNWETVIRIAHITTVEHAPEPRLEGGSTRSDHGRIVALQHWHGTEEGHQGGNMNNQTNLVAQSGFFTGLHSGMGIAAKAMVVVFVVFTALNVEFANEIYSAIRG